MCDRCRFPGKFWLHISDNWKDEERLDMIEYLEKALTKSYESEDYLCDSCIHMNYNTCAVETARGKRTECEDHVEVTL